MKYEHLYRLEIIDEQTLADETVAYQHVFDNIRPHETLGLGGPSKSTSKINRLKIHPDEN